MTQIYTRGSYIIFRASDQYIVQNVAMQGFAHTHIEHFKTAKHLIDLSVHKRVPRHLSRYLLISLTRINDDENYVRHIKELLDNKAPKDNYHNQRRTNK